MSTKLLPILNFSGLSSNFSVFPCHFVYMLSMLKGGLGGTVILCFVTYVGPTWRTLTIASNTSFLGDHMNLWELYSLCRSHELDSFPCQVLSCIIRVILNEIQRFKETPSVDFECSPQITVKDSSLQMRLLFLGSILEG